MIEGGEPEVALANRYVGWSLDPLGHFGAEFSAVLDSKLRSAQPGQLISHQRSAKLRFIWADWRWHFLVVIGFHVVPNKWAGGIAILPAHQSIGVAGLFKT
jgi:hypothetical protein